jgi:hypothetical protein
MLLSKTASPSLNSPSMTSRPEHARLTSNGVVFAQPPTNIGTAVVAVFDDTNGNLIQLIEGKPGENHDDAAEGRTYGTSRCRAVAPQATSVIAWPNGPVPKSP